MAGRDIPPDDRADAPPVAVIGASMAALSFPGEDPVGRTIKFGRDADDPEVEIVGVVGDVDHYVLGETPIPQVYVPFAQRSARGIRFVVKSSVAPESLASAVRAVIGDVDPDQPLVDVQTARAMVDDAVSLPRFRTLLMSVFGIAALLLAAVGLYGVLAYSVSQRTREMGVRVALGASRGSVLGLVLREGVPLVLAGLLVGIAGSVALSRVLETFLFAVGTHDPVVFVAVPLVLALVALVAMLLPARRAARVDPVTALAESSP
jgi:putative ABC transport system permease protein